MQRAQRARRAISRSPRARHAVTPSALVVSPASTYRAACKVPSLLPKRSIAPFRSTRCADNARRWGWGGGGGEFRVRRENRAERSDRECVSGRDYRHAKFDLSEDYHRGVSVTFAGRNVTCVNASSLTFSIFSIIDFGATRSRAACARQGHGARGTVTLVDARGLSRSHSACGGQSRDIESGGGGGDGDRSPKVALAGERRSNETSRSRLESHDRETAARRCHQ